MLPLLLALTTANAQSSPVQWTWAEGKVRTWYVESLVVVPSPWMLGVWGTQGIGRTGKVRLSMVMSCTAVDANETTWDLSCEVRDAAIVAASVSGEDPAVIEAVAQHYAEGLALSLIHI